MHKILVLWAVPRSTSTAFEWMMRMRGDLTCFHEPFGEAWYHGEDARWSRRDGSVPAVSGLSFCSVWQKMREAAKRGPVFSKDFAHYVEHLWDAEFLACFNHSFLIRDPAKALASMFRQWPEFSEEDIGFAEQRSLFERLCDQDGATPPVIDSDDLLENPAGVVKAYCSAMHIDFIESALSWEPGDRNEVSWYDGGSWHDNLRNSTGLKPQSRGVTNISDLPKWVQDLHDTALPHYQHLHSHRLIAGEG